MDRWRYAQDDHPAYCTCVKCVDERSSASSKRRSPYRSARNPIERVIAWFRNIFR